MIDGGAESAWNSYTQRRSIAKVCNGPADSWHAQMARTALCKLPSSFINAVDTSWIATDFCWKGWRHADAGDKSAVATRSYTKKIKRSRHHWSESLRRQSCLINSFIADLSRKEQTGFLCFLAGEARSVPMRCLAIWPRRLIPSTQPHHNNRVVVQQSRYLILAFSLFHSYGNCKFFCRFCR